MDWTADLGWLTAPTTTTLTLRGREITVRLLTSAQIDRLYEAYPEPIAPMGKDPGAGGKSTARVQRYDDPVYVKDFERAARERAYARIALMTADQPLIRPDGSLTTTSLQELRDRFAVAAKGIGLLTDAEKKLIVDAHDQLIRQLEGPQGEEDQGPTPP